MYIKAVQILSYLNGLRNKFSLVHLYHEYFIGSDPVKKVGFFKLTVIHRLRSFCSKLVQKWPISLTEFQFATIITKTHQQHEHPAGWICAHYKCYYYYYLEFLIKCILYIFFCIDFTVSWTFLSFNLLLFSYHFVQRIEITSCVRFINVWYWYQISRQGTKTTRETHNGPVITIIGPKY